MQSPLEANDDSGGGSPSSTEPGVITNGILSGLYVVVAIAFGLAYFYRRLPRTSTINAFIGLLITCCVLRAIYFGIPNSVWQLSETPEEDIPKYTHHWWLYITQFTIYITANAACLLCYLQILKLWDLALCVVHNSTDSNTEKALMWLSVIYLLWQTWLIFSNLLLGSGVVLFMASISHMVISISVALAFVLFWLRLWKAMTLLTLQRSRWQTLVQSLGACCVCFSCCGLGKQDEISVPLNDSTQLDNVASARAKLTRFTLLATVYTASSMLKAGVMIYQTAGALKKDFNNDSWFIVIFLDYLLTEIAVCFAVLLILWKPPKQPRMSSAMANAVMTSPDGSRLSLRTARQQRQSSAAERASMAASAAAASYLAGGSPSSASSVSNGGGGGGADLHTAVYVPGRGTQDPSASLLKEAGIGMGVEGAATAAGGSRRPGGRGGGGGVVVFASGDGAVGNPRASSTGSYR